MRGLTFSNELISRDEGMHCDTAILLYSKIIQKLDYKEIHEIFGDAVAIEKKFATESLPVSLIGMNSKLMCQYIEFISDRLLEMLNYEKMFGSQNPFDFMVNIGLDNKDNFFEFRPTEYQGGDVFNKSEKKIQISENF